MNLVRIWQLARFVIAFVAFRTVGELVIVYFGMGSTGLISAAALAAQHALLVTMLAMLVAAVLGERAYKLGLMILLSLSLFLVTAQPLAKLDTAKFGSILEMALDSSYVAAITLLAYFASNLVPGMRSVRSGSAFGPLEPPSSPDL